MQLRSFDHTIPRALCVGALLLAVAGFCHEAKAGFFQFSTTTTIGTVNPAPITIMANGSDFVTIMTAANTPIQFTGLSTVGPENLVAKDGGTDIVFGLIDVLVVNATPLQTLEIPFTFHLEITNYQTDTVGIPTGTATFNITGTMSGTIGAGRKVNMSNIVVDPVSDMIIGDQIYSLDINTVVPPGPFFPGAIGAHVSSVLVPEPATVTLLGLGLIGIATPALRRWRRTSRRVRI